MDADDLGAPACGQKTTFDMSGPLSLPSSDMSTPQRAINDINTTTLHLSAAKPVKSSTSVTRDVLDMSSSDNTSKLLFFSRNKVHFCQTEVRHTTCEAVIISVSCTVELDADNSGGHSIEPETVVVAQCQRTIQHTQISEGGQHRCIVPTTKVPFNDNIRRVAFNGRRLHPGKREFTLTVQELPRDSRIEPREEGAVLYQDTFFLRSDKTKRRRILRQPKYHTVDRPKTLALPRRKSRSPKRLGNSGAKTPTHQNQHIRCETAAAAESDLGQITSSSCSEDESNLNHGLDILATSAVNVSLEKDLDEKDVPKHEAAQKIGSNSLPQNVSTDAHRSQFPAPVQCHHHHHHRQQHQQQHHTTFFAPHQAGYAGLHLTWLPVMHHAPTSLNDKPTISMVSPQSSSSGAVAMMPSAGSVCLFHQAPSFVPLVI